MNNQRNATGADFTLVQTLPFDHFPRPDKLDRLRELRATIDCLRSERQAQDPLRAWIAAREKTQIF